MLNSKVKKEIPELFAVSRRAGKAITDYDLIQEGDKIAVAVSGGKDSISLLHVLRHRRAISPVKFDFTAVHIDFGWPCTSTVQSWPKYSPQSIIDYLEKHGFAYHVEKVDFDPGEDSWDDISCFWWSRNRRRALFEFTVKMGFTKIAFGHHLDDIVETILLNQFYRGEIGAMKPKQELFDGRIVIIRPLAYEREAVMRRLAEKLGIMAIGQSKCANDDTSHRMKIKMMLKEFEKDNPHVVKNIFRSLQNVKTNYLLDTKGFNDLE